MKQILITGANSYIGTSFESWLSRRCFTGMYKIDTLDLHNKNWKKKDFSGYDAILHVAGIVHKKETLKNTALFYKINSDLASEIAAKAKHDGVGQFVFISSMSIYGINSGLITKHTVPMPKSNYGKSKWQAEEKIKELEDEAFTVAILRLPVVYGPGCKGNYQRLRKIALRIPVFPSIHNQRTMIFIDSLSEYIRIVIQENRKGTFIPQNHFCICTSDMVKAIANLHGKKIIFVPGFGKLIRKIPISIVQKSFGDLVCIDNHSLMNNISFFESIKRTESETNRC